MVKSVVIYSINSCCNLGGDIILRDYKQVIMEYKIRKSILRQFKHDFSLGW
ncbi:hypothetical protein CoNPh35_CDS0038 [Staphylococcus phage S-CoN_Ph35]|nr:hypothetical protein CoNPh35_CDS0038 [Staphylococcus phage S-CoN_Ph35]